MADGATADDGRGYGLVATSMAERKPVGIVESGSLPGDVSSVCTDLSVSEQGLIGDLFAIIAEHSGRGALEIDRARVEDAFRFACAYHSDQVRHSGDDFIVHPVSVAKICAGLRLDTDTLVAALLHDTVEDTTASLEELRERFGEHVAALVDGVTKLTGITFNSHDEAQAENYRKMMVAMASDIRVILIKLADRLHNMRTLGAMPKQKQIEKARETLEIYAPIAHRLGIHAIKSELEDLSFATLHPRKYQEIKGLVNQQREEREAYVSAAAAAVNDELQELGIEATISGRAKHFYSIYSKMTKKGREFNEIYDLVAMRVIVDSVKDCYGVVGVIHSLWKPLPGRFKDFIAMPKFNMYQSLHTTVIGPEGMPLEIQIRTDKMHELAEYGVAAHWMYKIDPYRLSDDDSERLSWVRAVAASDDSDARDFMESLKVNLFDEEVFVFTPRGDVKSLAAGATPLDFAYEVHTEVGHRCVGAKVNGKIVPLSYQLQSGDIVEILTSKRDRGPSRDWLALVRTSRARNKIRAFFKAETREDTEHLGRELLQNNLRKQGLPPQKIAGSALLADVIREMGFRKAEDFYIALGSDKVSPTVVVNKVMNRLKHGEAAEDETDPMEALVSARRTRKPTGNAGSYGIRVDGVDDVLVRLAKCCRPVPGDPIVGYVSLGRGITIHRDDCANTSALRKAPERFVPVAWEGEHQNAFRVEIQIDGWDRHRMLEDLARAISEGGLNIVEARCNSNPPMIRNQFIVEVADTQTLKQVVSRLRNVEGVFDAYRITPGGGG